MAVMPRSAKTVCGFIADIHAFIVGQDVIGAEGAGELLRFGNNGAAARRRKKCEWRIATAGCRRVNVDHEMGMAHKLVEQRVRNERSEIAAPVTGKGCPGIGGILVHGRMQHVADEVAVLDLERERVLHGDEEEGATQRPRV